MGRRAGLAVAAVALALAGCKDLGVRGAANVPLPIARTKPPAFWSYQAVNPQQRKPYQGRTGDVVTAGNQQFLVQFPDFSGPPSLLAPVGGQGVYALRWDQPPYSQVYVAPGPDRLQAASEIWR